MRQVLWAAAGAFLLKLALAGFTVGTNDALTWERDLAVLRSAGFEELYRDGVQYRSPSGKLCPRQAFIHPPAVLNGLRALGTLQDVSGLPLRFWMRAACALADAGMLALVWLLRVRGAAALTAVALSPVSILVSGFHTNTDPVMLFCVVASVFLAERGSPLRAGIAFGLACSVKLIPVIFGPAILLCMPTPRNRVRWLGAAAAVWIALSLPYFARAPVLILRTMLGYDSAVGLWGFGLLAGLLPGSRTALAAVTHAKWVALLGAASVPLAMRFLGRRPSLFTQCGGITFAFLFFSPGFGLQYLSWTVPWIVLLNLRAMTAYHTVAGAYLLVVYVTASVGPGAYADLFDPRNFPVRMLMGLICWIAVGAVAWRWARWAGPPPGPLSTPGVLPRARCGLEATPGMANDGGLPLNR